MIHLRVTFLSNDPEVIILLARDKQLISQVHMTFAI